MKSCLARDVYSIMYKISSDFMQYTSAQLGQIPGLINMCVRYILVITALGTIRRTFLPFPERKPARRDCSGMTLTLTTQVRRREDKLVGRTPQSTARCWLPMKTTTTLNNDVGRLPMQPHPIVEKKTDVPCLKRVHGLERVRASHAHRREDARQADTTERKLAHTVCFGIWCSEYRSHPTEHHSDSGSR